MIGMSHVILHAVLCARAAKLGAGAPLAMNVQLVDRTGRQHFETPFRLERGSESAVILEFDAPQGVYKMQVQAPKYACSATDYIALLPEHNRNVTETLRSGSPSDSRPMLLQGTAPPSFLYVAPTFVLFPGDTACNKPVEDPLPSNIQVENDQDAFYVWLYSAPNVPPESQMVVLRLATATGEYHYIKLRVPFPEPWGGWPQSIQFNVNEDDIDWLAGQPIDVLLCPKLFRTSVG